MTLEEARKLNSGIRILSNPTKQAEKLLAAVEAEVAIWTEACAAIAEECGSYVAAARIRERCSPVRQREEER